MIQKVPHINIKAGPKSGGLNSLSFLLIKLEMKIQPAFCSVLTASVHL